MNILRKTRAIFLLLAFLASSCGGDGSGEPDGGGDVIPPPNAAPATTDLSGLTIRNFPFAGYLPGSDLDGPVRTFSIVSNGAFGTATITNTSTGEFVYTPDEDATGADSFTFMLSDSLLESNVSTVVIDVRYSFELRRGTLAGDPAVFTVQLPPSAVSPGLVLSPSGVPGEFGCATALISSSQFEVSCFPLSDASAAPTEVVLTGTGVSGDWSGEVLLQVSDRSTDVLLTPVSPLPLVVIEGLGPSSRDLDVTLSGNLLASGSGPVAIRLVSAPSGISCNVFPGLVSDSSAIELECSGTADSESGNVELEAVSVCNGQANPGDPIEMIRETAFLVCPENSSDPSAPFVARATVPIQAEVPTLVLQPDSAVLYLARQGVAETIGITVADHNTEAFFPVSLSVDSFPAGVSCSLPDAGISGPADFATLSCNAGTNAVAGPVILLASPAMGLSLTIPVLVSVSAPLFSLVTDEPEIYPVVNSYFTGNSTGTLVTSGPGSVFTGPALLSILSYPSGIFCQFSGDGDLDDSLDSDFLDCVAEDVSSDGYVVFESVTADSKVASTVVSVLRIVPLMLPSQSESQLTVPGSLILGIDPLSDPEIKYPVFVSRISQPAGAGCTVGGADSGQLPSEPGTLVLNCTGSVTGSVGIRYTSSNAESVTADISVTLVLP